MIARRTRRWLLVLLGFLLTFASGPSNQIAGSLLGSDDAVDHFNRNAP